MQYSDKPLVSVIVIAYNSSAFIEATLDSIREQTYGNIELIITDDGSGDHTLRLAEAWVGRYGAHFQRVEILAAEKNTGISGNCNRGWRVSEGAWIKIIAADDLLLPNCIADNVSYVSSVPGVDFVFSRMNRIDAEGAYLGPYFYPASFFSQTVEKQLELILSRNYLSAPSGFISRRALILAGGFDESYPMMEDLPLWTKLLSLGVRAHGLDKITVAYRTHQGAIQSKSHQFLQDYLRANARFDQEIRLPTAREKSIFLYLVLQLEVGIAHIVRRRVLYLTCYPLLWIWAHCKPYRLPRSLTPKPDTANI